MDISESQANSLVAFYNAQITFAGERNVIPDTPALFKELKGSTPEAKEPNHTNIFKGIPMRMQKVLAEPLHYGTKKSVKGSNRSLLRLLQESSLYQNEFKSLTSGIQVVMLAIGHYATDNKNLIHLGGDTLKVVAEETGFTIPSVRNAITALSKCGIIEPTGLKGEYIINPMFALKGDYKAIWKSYQIIEAQRRTLNGSSSVPVHPVESIYSEVSRGLSYH